MLSMLVAICLCAQTTSTTTPPTPPAPAQVAANIVARLTTLLDLTSDQQASATTLFTNQVTVDQALQTQMQAARTALQTAITSNSGISTAAAAIGSLTTQQVANDATTDAAFYASLTSTQQAKYTSLQPLGQGPGGGGPGGPGRPPAGGGPGH